MKRRKKKGLRHDLLVIAHEVRAVRLIALKATVLAAAMPVFKGIAVLLSQ